MLNSTKLREFFRQLNLLSIIVLIGFILISATWFTAAIQIDRDYQTTVGGIYRDNSNLVKAFEEHVRRSLIASDNKLKLLKEEYERESAVTPAVRALLRPETSDSAVSQSGIMDSRGDIIAVMSPTSFPPGNAADREFFKLHRESPNLGLIIDKPLLGITTGKWSIIMTRRLSNPDGTFNGVVSVALLSDYFGQFYRQMELGEGKVVVLVGLDGIIRARQDNMDFLTGLDVSKSELYQHAIRTPSDSLLVTSVTDGQQRFYSYRVLPDYPLYVAVGVLKDQALAVYYQHRLTYILGAVFATLIMLIAGYIILRYGKKEARMQKALQYSNEKFTKAYYTSPDSVNINRLSDGLYIEVNQGFVKMSGYSREEALGKRSSDLNIWVNKQDRINLVKMLKESGEVNNLEAECRTKSGDIRNCLVSATVIELEGELCILSVIRDITERKTMEKELRVSEETLSKVFHTSYTASTVARLEDGFFYNVNESFCLISGYGRDELIGNSAARLGLWANPEERSKLVEQIKNQGMIANDTVQLLRCKDGSERLCEISWQLIEINGEQCLISALSDITDRKKREKEDLENQQKINRLERLSSLGTLAAGIAHEINQPLQALKVTADGMLYWLDQGKALEPEKLQENCRRISRSAQRISSIVKRLRDFVHRSRSADMSAVNLDDVEKGAIELLGERLKSHTITLRERLSSEPAILWGNSGRLEEIYINLMVNAMHALDMEDEANKEIVITTECSMDKVVLEIFNNGPSIPQEIIEQIYDPFFSTKTPNGENMGLGLSIVQSIVREHGGLITAINHEEGVSFRMEFPRYRGQ